MLDAGFKRGGCMPAQVGEAGDVEEFAGGAVWFAGVEGDFSVVAECFGDQVGELGYADVFAGAEVNKAWFWVVE